MMRYSDVLRKGWESESDDNRLKAVALAAIKADPEWFDCLAEVKDDVQRGIKEIRAYQTYEWGRFGWELWRKISDCDMRWEVVEEGTRKAEEWRALRLRLFPARLNEDVEYARLVERVEKEFYPLTQNDVIVS
jgi:hypothetical protein